MAAASVHLDLIFERAQGKSLKGKAVLSVEPWARPVVRALL